MNFISRTDETGPRLMKHGDLIIIYERHDSLTHIYLSKGSILNNKFGAFYHDDFIGKPFGSKIVSRNTTGWMYALEPSPELWSLAVHTRTQIVNELDASVITFNLDVFPGCVVVESGNLTTIAIAVLLIMTVLELEMMIVMMVVMDGSIGNNDDNSNDYYGNRVSRNYNSSSRNYDSSSDNNENNGCDDSDDNSAV
jgi:hypothetical protein